uniref:Alpha-carbonic anhydrase domain-containing protein n=1 Tax=Steinernema glaseri TaxID=37863 RepID=A0A1I7Z8U8_9BILA
MVLRIKSTEHSHMKPLFECTVEVRGRGAKKVDLADDCQQQHGRQVVVGNHTWGVCAHNRSDCCRGCGGALYSSSPPIMSAIIIMKKSSYAGTRRVQLRSRVPSVLLLWIRAAPLSRSVTTIARLTGLAIVESGKSTGQTKTACNSPERAIHDWHHAFCQARTAVAMAPALASLRNHSKHWREVHILRKPTTISVLLCGVATDIGTTAGFGAYPNGKISLPLCANTRRRKDEDCDGLRSSLYSNEVAPFKMTIFLRFGVDVNND